MTEKGSAEERYEEAVSDGNTAIMLEKHESWLYTMNVGNISAGQEISITITYAELHLWQKDVLRFHLPTTIAPRYGDSEAAGLQPHQIPEYDLLTEISEENWGPDFTLRRVSNNEKSDNN